MRIHEKDRPFLGFTKSWSQCNRTIIIRGNEIFIIQGLKYNREEQMAYTHEENTGKKTGNKFLDGMEHELVM